MSQHFAVLKTVEREANRKISRQVSEYTTGLRGKLDRAVDFKAEYERIFGDFADKKIPKDDLYYSIKNEIDLKHKHKKKTKKKDQNPALDAPILPSVPADDMDEI